MAATKNATSVFSNALTGNVVSASVARSTGEGLLCAVWQETDFAAVGTAGAPVWDAAGDNQTFTSVVSMQEAGPGSGVNRRLSLFVLPAPTTVKTGTVESTLSGSHDRASMMVVRISGHDAADMIRASNANFEASPQTNDLPNTVTSAVGDLVVFFGSIRESTSELDPGDTSGFESFSTALSSRILVVGTKAGAASSTTGTFNYINATGQSNALIAVSIKAGAAPAPVLTSPTGAATGSTNANAGATIDTVSGSGSRILYALPRVGGSQASSASIIASGTQLAVTTSGAKTIALSALTTNVGAVADLVYVDATTGTSNVVTTGSFTPSTLAISGTGLGSQIVVTGAALTWSGFTPESLVTNIGVGTAGTPWTVLSGAGSSGATCNASTGILVVGTAGTVGSYTITLQRADGSTAGAAIPQTVTKTVGLTITTGGAASAVLLGGPTSGIVGIASTNFTVSANGTISGTVSVSPTDSGGGGAFTPSSVNISSGSPTATFTYTPGTAGTKSITVTNGGALSNPAAISYVATAATGGTLTLDDFKQWTGTPHVSITVPFVKVFRLDGVIALELTSQAVSVGSDMVISNAALSAGVVYMVFGFNADGSMSFKRRITAT